MRKSNREVNGEKVFRYSIRKCHFGAASVAVAALMFFANGAVKADTLPVSPATANTEKVNAGVTNLTEGVPLEKSLEAEGNKEIVAPEPAEKISNKEDGAGSNAQDKKEVEVSENAVTLVNQTEEIKKSVKDVKVEEVFTNKTKLETLLKEIDKLNPEKYTEDSVKRLKEKVAKAKEVLTTAKNQEEVNTVYKELVNYKNSSLRRVKTNHKPLEEYTPKLDTTNGKETVGKEAENTDPNDRNIAGHNHSMNGTSLPEGSGLRTAPKPELADVQIGRWNGTRRTFDRSNVFVTPANQGIVGNVMKIKAISASDNFTNIEVTGNQGFPLQVKKKINGKEAELYFEGNTPSNGSWNMTVTATTAKGTKSFNFGYYTALRKPTILTQNTALEGKAKEKPTIEVEVPTFSPAPTGSKFKVYLVRGGSTNGWDNSGNAYPSGYSVLASADVVASTGGKGTAIINASNYRVSELGTTAFKAITVIELNGRENDTDPGERGSWFSDERRATERLANKSALTAALSDETTTKGTPAYYNAEASKKTAYDNAVAAGKVVLAKDNATQTEVNDAVSAITNAKNALGGNATNKDALQTATSTGDTETKATPAYYNAEASKKDAYDQAVTAGKVVLAKDNATQTEVNNALSAITTAKEKLDGAPFPTEIEKSNAIAEVKKALDTKIKSIESSKEFTDNDKGILKDKAEKAAMAAIVRIKTATTNVAVETAKIEGIERINSIEANLPATLDFPEFTGEVNGEIVEPTETLKEEQGGENKPQPASVVPSDDTTRDPEVVTSNSQPVSSENNVPKQNDSKSHAALPNTGTKEDRATGSLGVLSLLGAFGLLFAKKKKDDEEEA